MDPKASYNLLGNNCAKVMAACMKSYGVGGAEPEMTCLPGNNLED